MSDASSYNLLCEPWIPVVWKSDAAQPTEPKIGIRDALLRAQDIKCSSHTVPFIEFGLYRLLITIVLDAYIVAGKRPTIGKMKAMLKDEKFDPELLGKYIDDDERKDRFDLWAESNAFLQRKLPCDGNKKPATKPVVTMFAAIPSGINVAHWHHFKEDEGEVAEDIAAQFLTTVSPWNFKTKPGEARTLAGDPPMYAIILGENLFETIVLNLPRTSGRMTAKQERDNGPIWRTPLDDLSKLPKVPSVAQGYTWPVRIVTLENHNGRVGKAVFKAAYKKPTEKAIKANEKKVAEDKVQDVLYEAPCSWRDPHTGTETTRDAINHIKARSGVPIWRDAIPLFLTASQGESLRGDKRRSRPEVVTNALRVLDTPQFRVAVFGMRKKGGGGGDVKVEEWFRSVLTLPSEVARDSRLSASVIAAFGKLQRVADTLQIALRMLRASSEARKTKRGEVHRGESNVIADFWQRLEPLVRRTYLTELAESVSGAEGKLWKEVKRHARDAFKQATGPHRRTADGLFRIANARNWFERRLARLLPKEPRA